MQVMAKTLMRIFDSATILSSLFLVYAIHTMYYIRRRKDKSGLAAQIVEVLSGGDMYVADVSAAGGWEDDDTVFVSPGEIERKA